MVKMFAIAAASAVFAAAVASAASVPDGTWPTSTGTVQYAEAYTVKAGEVFDGKMQTFERSDISCEGQTESGSNTAVFLVEAGGTLKNAIIGKNQMEGVHCDNSDCTIDNVWWDDVCEDALSIKGGSASSVSTVTGGGARNADDKVIQHNGLGSVKIDGFYAETFGKLYRSCGTCGDKARKVSMSNVYAVNPSVSIVTVNENWGDEATLSNIYIKSSDNSFKVCAWSQGNANGEPTELGDGIKAPLCQYSESDIHVNGEVSSATSTSSNSTSSAATTSSGSSTSSTTQTQTSSSSTTQQSSDDETSAASTSSSLRGDTQQGSSESTETSAPSTVSSDSADNKDQDEDSKDQNDDYKDQDDDDNKDKDDDDN